MTDTHKVTVVVATYRRNESLSRALASLLAQTYSNLEIIIVDDNADAEWNERVRIIVEKYVQTARAGYTIRLIQNENNLGSAKSRNKAIFAASGDYITFLDDDDIYLPEKVKAQLQNLIENNADYGITDLYLYTDDDKLCSKRIRSYIKSYKPDQLIKYHLLYHMTGTDTLMFTRDYLQKIGGFMGADEGDEFYLMRDAILAGGKLSYLPESHIKAYVHQGETSGLSCGERKIKGEIALLAEKQKLFHYLSAKERRYVLMRHHAVVAYAELRRRNIIQFITSAAKSFLTAPISCVYLFINKR